MQCGVRYKSRRCSHPGLTRRAAEREPLPRPLRSNCVRARPRSSARRTKASPETRAAIEARPRAVASPTTPPIVRRLSHPRSPCARPAHAPRRYALPAATMRARRATTAAAAAAAVAALACTGAARVSPLRLTGGVANVPEWTVDKQPLRDRVGACWNSLSGDGTGAVRERCLDLCYSPSRADNVNSINCSECEAGTNGAQYFAQCVKDRSFRDRLAVARSYARATLHLVRDWSIGTGASIGHKLDNRCAECADALADREQLSDKSYIVAHSKRLPQSEQYAAPGTWTEHQFMPADDSLVAFPDSANPVELDDTQDEHVGRVMVAAIAGGGAGGCMLGDAAIVALLWCCFCSSAVATASSSAEERSDDMPGGADEGSDGLATKALSTPEGFDSRACMERRYEHFGQHGQAEAGGAWDTGATSGAGPARPTRGAPGALEDAAVAVATEPGHYAPPEPAQQHPVNSPTLQPLLFPPSPPTKAFETDLVSGEVDCGTHLRGRRSSVESAAAAPCANTYKVIVICESTDGFNAVQVPRPVEQIVFASDDRPVTIWRVATDPAAVTRGSTVAMASSHESFSASFNAVFTLALSFKRQTARTGTVSIWGPVGHNANVFARLLWAEDRRNRSAAFKSGTTYENGDSLDKDTAKPCEVYNCSAGDMDTGASCNFGAANKGDGTASKYTAVVGYLFQCAPDGGLVLEDESYNLRSLHKDDCVGTITGKSFERLSRTVILVNTLDIRWNMEEHFVIYPHHRVGSERLLSFIRFLTFLFKEDQHCSVEIVGAPVRGSCAMSRENMSIMLLIFYSHDSGISGLCGGNVPSGVPRQSSRPGTGLRHDFSASVAEAEHTLWESGPPPTLPLDEHDAIRPQDSTPDSGGRGSSTGDDETDSTAPDDTAGSGSQTGGNPNDEVVLSKEQIRRKKDMLRKRMERDKMRKDPPRWRKHLQRDRERKASLQRAANSAIDKRNAKVSKKPPDRACRKQQGQGLHRPNAERVTSHLHAHGASAAQELGQRSQMIGETVLPAGRLEPTVAQAPVSKDISEVEKKNELLRMENERLRRENDERGLSLSMLLCALADVMRGEDIWKSLSFARAAPLQPSVAPSGPGPSAPGGSTHDVPAAYPCSSSRTPEAGHNTCEPGAAIAMPPSSRYNPFHGAVQNQSCGDVRLRVERFSSHMQDENQNTTCIQKGCMDPQDESSAPFQARNAQLEIPDHSFGRASAAPSLDRSIGGAANGPPQSRKLGPRHLPSPVTPVVRQNCGEVEASIALPMSASGNVPSPSSLEGFTNQTCGDPLLDFDLLRNPCGDDEDCNDDEQTLWKWLPS